MSFPDPKTATISSARSYFQSTKPSGYVFTATIRIMFTAWVSTYTNINIPVTSEGCIQVKKDFQKKYQNICKIKSVLPIETEHGKYWQVTFSPSSSSILQNIVTCVFVRKEKPDTVNNCKVLCEGGKLHEFSPSLERPQKLLFNGRNVTKYFTGKSRLSENMLRQLDGTMTRSQSRLRLQNCSNLRKLAKTAIPQDNQVGNKRESPQVISNADVKPNQGCKISSCDPSPIYNKIESSLQMRYFIENLPLVIKHLALLTKVVNLKMSNSFGTHTTIELLRAALLHNRILLEASGLRGDNESLICLCNEFITTNRIDRDLFNGMLLHESEVVSGKIISLHASMSTGSSGDRRGILDLPTYHFKFL